MASNNEQPDYKEGYRLLHILSSAVTEADEAMSKLTNFFSNREYDTNLPELRETVNRLNDEIHTVNHQALELIDK